MGEWRNFSGVNRSDPWTTYEPHGCVHRLIEFHAEGLAGGLLVVALCPETFMPIQRFRQRIAWV